VINFLETTGANNDNRITYDMDSNLSLKSNSQLLEIVVRNIVENACKYTDKGIVSITAYLSNDQICISCQDTGKGMSAEDIETILQQKDVEINFSGSFKMGYKVILKILESLGSKIQISSKVGVGTKVLITLPLE
jgi:K+-sensing histidine kinase KdpD